MMDFVEPHKLFLNHLQNTTNFKHSTVITCGELFFITYCVYPLIS